MAIYVCEQIDIGDGFITFDCVEEISKLPAEVSRRIAVNCASENRTRFGLPKVNLKSYSGVFDEDEFIEMQNRAVNPDISIIGYYSANDAVYIQLEDDYDADDIEGILVREDWSLPE